MKAGKSYDITTTSCPYCGYEMDATFCTRADVKPRPGDASLCAKCGGICLFNKEIGLRKPTEDEEKQLSMNPQIIEAQILIRGLKR